MPNASSSYSVSVGRGDVAASRLRPGWLKVAGAVILSVTGCAVSAASLEAGFAKADITPDTAMLNWTVPGARPYEAVHDPLLTRVIVLSDGERRIALIVWDLLDAREYAVARVRAAVQKATGITDVVIAATHNHSGPKTEMGPSPASAREERTSRPAQQTDVYQQWADRLVETCVQLVRSADGARQPVTLTLGRAYVGEWLFNRRPIRPDGTVVSTLAPKNPYVLGEGLRFGVVDPTMTVLGLRDTRGRNLCLLFHLPMHAVAAYSTYKGISADWPGRVIERIAEGTATEALFLQGCAGDIVPARRGFEAIEEMSALIAARAAAASEVAVELKPGPLRISRAELGLPLTPAASKELGRATVSAEIGVVSCGPLALVTLPGEPLLELGTAIRDRSPFPHTIVLGYANGRGAGYVGLPGGKARGGYEMSEVGAGADEAGHAMVETAVRLLREHATALVAP